MFITISPSNIEFNSIIKHGGDMNFYNIPKELQSYNNWVVWKYENVNNSKTKVPYDAKYIFGTRKASVTDNQTWSSFDISLQSFAQGYDGIGFVFSENDPYTFIDLDDPFSFKHNYTSEKQQEIAAHHQRILGYLNSYTEISPSGKGAHIIIKGNVPDGRRKECVEIYSKDRYATFTGNIVGNNKIEIRQKEIDELYKFLTPKNILTNKFVDQPQSIDDNEVIRKALAAKNGEHFKSLLSGDWSFMGNASQSEADFAFINIIGFYSRNKEQIKRIFQSSVLGNRKKAERIDYVDKMIERSFDNMLPVLDLDIYHENLASIAFPHEEEEVYVVPESPPGLMGEIASYIYSSAFSPVPEIAIAGAIGLMAGICGKAFNVNGSGLNQYVIMLAQTGAGKEAPATAIDKLFEVIKQSVPSSISFRGPSEIASGQAFRKHLTKKSSCFVSILGEFGMRLQALSSPRAAQHELMVKRLLLDLYNKSGKGRILGESIYSDNTNNSDIVISPSVSILCESTPETFYNCIDENMIRDGLLPRFTIIEFKGKLPDVNYNSNKLAPPKHLTDALIDLTSRALNYMNRGVCVDVEFTEEAEEVHRRYNKQIRDILNKNKSEATSELYNRAHMNVLRLAALVAIGINPNYPIIDKKAIDWSIYIINKGIESIKRRFELGEVGSEVADVKQLNSIKRASAHYFISTSTYGCDPELKKDHIIPYNYFIRRLINTQSFKKDKQGATSAIKRAIQTLIDQDILREVPKNILMEKYSTTQRGFIVNNWNALSEKGA